MNDYGQDILLDRELQPLVAANGELLLTRDNYAVVQDVIFRLRTLIETLFYDLSFGSKLFLYIKSENTHDNRMQMKSEVVRTIKKDTRIEQSSVVCTVDSYDDDTIEMTASLLISGDSTVYSLLISLGQEDFSVLVKDR